jgi:ABC-type uncharacterized transport system permease subunit
VKPAARARRSKAHGFPTVLQILDSSIRLATPLLLACLAGLFSERAGIFDIGLEGKMLIRPSSRRPSPLSPGSVWVGLLAGIGRLDGAGDLHGLASITFRGNQLISGVAINFLAAGLTVVIAQSWFQQGGRTPALSGAARFDHRALCAESTIRAHRARPGPDLFRADLGPLDPRLRRAS